MNRGTDTSGTEFSGLSTSASWYLSVPWFSHVLFLYLGGFGGEMTWETNFRKLVAIGRKIAGALESL